VSATPPGEIVRRRLRAHGLVPAGEPVKLECAGSRVRRGKLQWTAVHPVTGAGYGVGSLFSLTLVAASRRWNLVAGDGGMTLVEPERSRD
jgi:hypothetical protein